MVMGLGQILGIYNKACGFLKKFNNGLSTAQGSEVTACACSIVIDEPIEIEKFVT